MYIQYRILLKIWNPRKTKMKKHCTFYIVFFLKIDHRHFYELWQWLIIINIQTVNFDYTINYDN